MGCWNETCGISQIAIRSGDPVVGVFIQESGRLEPAGECNTTNAWSPAFLPIRGTYDEYGRIENIVKDWNTDYIIQYLKQHCTEMEVGENRFHDRAVSRETMNLTTAQEAMTDGRLELPGLWIGEGMPKNVPCRVGLMFVHADIWDQMVSRTIGSYYEQSCKKFTKKYLDQLTDRDELIKSFGDDELKTSLALFHLRSEFRGIAEITARSIKQYMLDHTLPNAELAARFAELEMACVTMDRLRRSWLPQTGKGSQDDDRDTMRALAKAVESVYCAREKIEAEW